MEYKLILYPNDILNQVSATVDSFEKELKDQVNAMIKIMKDNNGIGLSAVQVGVLNQVIVMDTTEKDAVNGFKGCIINPVIMRRGTVKREHEEMCLSFPGVKIKTKRSIEVSIKYKNLGGKVQFTTLKGISAICFLHEYDHLQGETFLKFKGH